LIAIVVSYNFDFPTGYTIVFFHSLCAFLVTILKRTKQPDAENA
jgi:ABC-type Mn2+/Zn2+ transport system permease subunit